MNSLRFTVGDDASLECHTGDGRLLFRYVARPDTPRDESPRPYAHPVCALSGEVLTNFRPNDHPWHHGLSFTINHLADWNFWGGPTYRPGRGYHDRADHGVQRHLAWAPDGADAMQEQLEWLGGGERLLAETRCLQVAVLSPQSWSLRWRSTLRNVTARTLVCSNYHSGAGLVGSHYTGLQFRGARELLDDHGDQGIGLGAEGGREGEAQVHGAAAPWMEWRAQKDGSLRRLTIRFANGTGPLHWFVRRHNPLAAFPFQFDRDFALPPAAALEIDHTLTFTDA